MAPRKKDKAKSAARKHKRAGKDVLRDIYDMCPEAEGEIAVNNAGKEMRINSLKLFSLPKSLGTLDGLEALNLSDCLQLLELPESIGELKALTDLDLRGCASLTKLPATIGELGALTELNLATCTSLIALPDAIGELGALAELNLTACTSLIALPDAIGQLGALTWLSLQLCSSLTALPDSIGKLGALTKLILAGCSSLVALPDAIGGLKALTELDLRDCSSLTALPESIGELGALKELLLHGCSSLAALPDAIGELGALTELSLCGCSSLVALPESIGRLDALTRLDLRSCSSLTTLPDAIRAMPGLTICDSNSGLDKTGREKPEAALRCPISTALLVKPLRAKPCGHVYSKASVQGYYGGARKRCAVFGCEAMLSCWDFVPDVPTEIALENYKEHVWTAGAEEAADKALADLRMLNEFEATDRGQPEEEHKAEILRKILEESEDTLSDAEMLTLRRYRRRVCDACGRQGTVQEERFPVCWCGARRYCNEACQLVDWDRGHSATCASGHTFPQERLDALRALPVLRECLKRAPKENHDGRAELIVYPPPADRPR